MERVWTSSEGLPRPSVKSSLSKGKIWGRWRRRPFPFNGLAMKPHGSKC